MIAASSPLTSIPRACDASTPPGSHASARRQTASKAGPPPRRSPPRRDAVLLPANIGIHISRRHYASLAAERHQLARPMMRRPGGLELHQTGGREAKNSSSLLRLIALATTTRARSI